MNDLRLPWHIDDHYNPALDSMVYRILNKDHNLVATTRNLVIAKHICDSVNEGVTA